MLMSFLFILFAPELIWIVGSNEYYGCILSDDFDAVHVRAEDCDTRNKMRGSKYIQSRLGNTFRNVKKDLDAGRSVLFSGTSCQVAGLKQFLP